MVRTFLVVLVFACAAPAGALKVCFLEDDLPRAHRATESGFDFEIMSELAVILDDVLEPVWIPSQDGFSEIESSDLPLDKVASGECVALASVPGEAALGRYRDELYLSKPYYGAGFELIGAASVGTLDELRGKKVAVRLQSLAHAALGALGVDWMVRPTVEEMLALVESGEADAALAWGPALAPLGRKPAPGFEPPQALRWNEHVVIRADVPLGAWINLTLDGLAESGRLEALAHKYGIPYHPPFATTSDPAAIRRLRSGG
ncbi:MAG: transporter substrate-binding domain-containing protein [Acidobacteriota bacterium]|nr:transporter substrate-binding domain-containing protein [Acidobacteriota bacterium]